MKDTRLREDISTDRIGQKDLEKLYWERDFGHISGWDLL